MTKQEDRMHPEHPDCPFVSKVVCESRTRISRWTIGIFLGTLTVFLALVVYAADEATDANHGYVDMTNQLSTHKQEVQDDVSGLRSDLSKHQGEQRISERMIAEKLSEIKKDLSEKSKEQRELLERILEIQIKIAGEHPGGG